jgi:hypothetical protein
LQARKSQLADILDSQRTTAPLKAFQPTKKLTAAFPPNKEKTKLLFDTNCYISDLDTIKRILSEGWNVVLPLAGTFTHIFLRLTFLFFLCHTNTKILLFGIVVMELDGLQFNTDSSAADKRNTAHGAKESLAWLETMLLPNAPTPKPSHLLLITSQNRILPVLTVRTEDWGDDPDVRCVDDVLLRSASWESGGMNLREDGVLVTGDVNLRLKARANGVLTGSLRDVAAWLKFTV